MRGHGWDRVHSTRDRGQGRGRAGGGAGGIRHYQSFSGGALECSSSIRNNRWGVELGERAG